MRRNCIVCQGIIFRKNHPTKQKLRRGKTNVTCSKKCARIYYRVSKHLRGLINKRKKKKK